MSAPREEISSCAGYNISQRDLRRNEAGHAQAIEAQRIEPRTDGRCA